MKRLGLAFLFFFNIAFAEPDYIVLEHPLAKKERVEITEYFYYGCRQCLELEPFLQQWSVYHPEIPLNRIPAYRPEWLPLVKTYYCLEIMGLEKGLRKALFISAQEMDLTNEAALFKWLGVHNVEKEKFLALYDSEEVRLKVEQSMEMTKSIFGTPSLIVDGTYLVLGNLAREELLEKLAQLALRQRK